MTYRIRFEPRAVAEIIESRKWWFANRPAAPEAFDEEFERARDFIRSMPHAGQLVRSRTRRELRRVLLGRIRYHLYYEVSGDVVNVASLWHSSRGRGPGL